MFEGLRSRLQKVTGSLEDSIEQNIPDGPAPAGTVARVAAAPAEEAGKDLSLISRVKVLITDREFIVSEKDIKEPLSELQIVLLENDVALPVADEILQRVKEDLTGRRRKIGEPLHGIVVNALRNSLLGVLGDGFDLVSYIRGHDRPVKILFTGVNGTGKTTTVAKVASYLKNQGFQSSSVQATRSGPVHSSR